MLQPQKSSSSEIRREAHVEASVSGENGRVLAVQIQTPLVDNEHRDFGSIFGGIPDLPHFVRGRVNSRCIHFVPKRSPPGAEINLVDRSEEHTSELQSPCNLVCRLLLEKKKRKSYRQRRL